MSKPVASVETLVELAKRGEHGRFWYQQCAEELKWVAEGYGRSLADVCAVTAILSPRCSVRRNMRLLGMWCRGWVFPPDVFAQKRRAVELYEQNRWVMGQKVRAFHANLTGDLGPVVLDTWMAVAMLPRGGVWPSVETRPLIVKASDRVREAAAVLSWKPAEVQAAIWCETYRANRGAEPPRLMARDALELPDDQEPTSTSGE